MPDEINPTLRTQLNAALGALKLTGLNDLALLPSSPDLLAAEHAQIAERQRRSDLIHAVLSALDAAQTALDALEADGYPDLPPGQLVGSLLTELKEKVAEIADAAAIFTPIPLATNMSVNLGAPVPKTKE